MEASTAQPPRRRWTRRHPCPICGGWNNATLVSGHWCGGYLSHDGKWAHCTSDRHAGNLTPQYDNPFVRDPLAPDSSRESGRPEVRRYAEAYRRIREEYPHASHEAVDFLIQSLNDPAFTRLMIELASS